MRGDGEKVETLSFVMARARLGCTGDALGFRAQPSTCRVTVLEAVVADMKKELMKVKEVLFATSTDTNREGDSSEADHQQTCTSFPKTYVSAATGGVKTMSGSLPLQPRHSSKNHLSPDSKYSIVSYGIEECPQGTSKPVRLGMTWIMLVIS